ncbi:MAG: glycoside hydrolase family 15 protein, partial [Acidobacteria bacterium]|nr:glycoside hydrolase family 15 protein [Acidobacteriota bacterium]
MTEIPSLDHGVIGNGQVIALVSPTTHIDWLCLPRFDSPSIFARLLDTDCGGSFGFDVPDDARLEMGYVRNTNVLRTRVTSADGDFDIFDYAPRIPSGLGVEAPIEIHRVLFPRRGNPRFRVRFDPRPDYARATPEVVEVARGLDVRGGPLPIFLRSNTPAPFLTNNLWIRLDTPQY